MQRPALPVAEPDERAVDGRDEPEDHGHEVNPYCMLHADLAILLRCWLGRDENASEESEQRGPEDEENPIPGEEPV